MMKEPLTVLEFYSGIGGMHYALNQANIKYKLLAAFDINTTANAVYKFNFSDSTLLQKNIEGFSVDYLEKFDADIWTMCPPCQPYTRQGKQEASKDARAKSFLHILKILHQMIKPPKYIFLENVKGFECSDTREMFLEALKAGNFTHQEFLISPSDVGIPNSRTRYYLAARRTSSFPFVCTVSPLSCTSETICNMQCKCNEDTSPEDTSIDINPRDTNPKDTILNDTVPRDAILKDTYSRDTCTFCVRKKLSVICKETTKHKISEFVMDNAGDSYLLGKGVLTKYHSILDIVHGDLSRSCCFTKAYGKYVEGTGSVFTEKSMTEVERIYKEVSSLSSEDEKYSLLESLKLRYFTPAEVARLMCFPDAFQFPEETTLKQKYRLLGNSVNVFVISLLMKNFLFAECE